MVSLQVHESILAAKVRDMSAQFGLGLAEDPASTRKMPTTNPHPRRPRAQRSPMHHRHNTTLS